MTPNCTLVELKLLRCRDGGCKVVVSPNCTLVELKYGIFELLGGAVLLQIVP